eukprot:maker-scaffold261_size233860-snap-gene-1.24 protein:Tk10683 transcript:maker-scaffold261_size233860-snap-gene-1.24-mRNA-1 annotation:"pdz and lim domain protein 3"
MGPHPNGWTDPPLNSIVNTAESTIFPTYSGGLDHDRQGLISCILRKKNLSETWGFRLQGGKDRGIPFQIQKVPINSVAGLGGCRPNDYLVQINGRNVFELTHDEAKNLITNSGESLDLVIERGDNIVPSMGHMFPKAKKDPPAQELPSKPKPYYQRHLEETGELPGQQNKGFTTVGKPKMTTKQYMSPLEMYGEEALEEILDQGTIFGKEINVLNPWNMTGKELDLNKSSVLNSIRMSDNAGVAGKTATSALVQPQPVVVTNCLRQAGRPRSDVGGEENLVEGVPRAIRPILTVEGSPHLHGHCMHSELIEAGRTCPPQ